jgi:hypothetical protein
MASYVGVQLIVPAMRRSTTSCLTGLVLLAASFLTWAEGTPDEREENRRRIEEMRAKEPEKLQHLRTNASVFLGLPEERRQKMLHLDQELQKENAKTQGRLARVMDRYVTWLDALDPRDRQRIKDAPDKNARLAIVQELRDDEWMRYQPKALRDQYAALQGRAKAELAANLRAQERQRRLDWHIAGRFWKELDKGTPLPSRLADFPADVNVYVNEYLRPMLSVEERDQLAKTEGQWPLYPVTLVSLADRHPPALPGEKGPKTLAELPTEVRNRLKTKTGAYPARLVKAEKRWPQFAVAVTSFVKEKKNFTLPNELWPWGYSCLSTQMKDFVDKKLMPALDNDDKLRLILSEGKWPDYPVAVQEISKKHNMRAPWHTLPGPRDRWERYRLGSF